MEFAPVPYDVDSLSGPPRTLIRWDHSGNSRDCAILKFSCNPVPSSNSKFVSQLWSRREEKRRLALAIQCTSLYDDAE